MTIALAGLAIALGALVQGSVGFGIALVAAPLLAIIDPRLVPVPMLLLATAHAMLTLRREYRDTDWTGVAWALLGRLPGIVIGVLAVALLPPRWFGLAVAVVVLTCVGLSMVRWRPRPTVPALLLAGVVSGAAGTASAIGGPPVALLYQHAHGARLRATMAAYFVVGSLLSLTGLLVGGQFSADAVGAAAVMVPFLIAGFALSGPLRRHLDHGWTRPAVLAMAGAGALALLGQVTLG
ncbi:TSUP family transporter [Pseudonocardia sp. DLS-67]